MKNDTAGTWVNMNVSGWDEKIDVSRFCHLTSGTVSYYVKAVVYHVHPHEGSANIASGHYVAYVK